jgi:hypothetical protein
VDTSLHVPLPCGVVQASKGGVWEFVQHWMLEAPGQRPAVLVPVQVEVSIQVPATPLAVQVVGEEGPVGTPEQVGPSAKPEAGDAFNRASVAGP